MTKTNEREVKLVSMIRGIAQRCSYKFFDLSIEEIEQELWVNLLEREAAEGREFDLNLAARVCYNKIVDMQRYGSHRNHSSLDRMLEFTEEEDCSFGAQSEEYSSDFTSKVMIEDLFKLFPKGSKERVFLEFWSTYSGVKDFGIPVGSAPESELARLLGYAGTASGGYKRFRNKMRNFVAIYFEVER